MPDVKQHVYIFTRLWEDNQGVAVVNHVTHLIDSLF